MRQDDSPISLPTASRVKLTVTHTLPLPSTTTSTTTTTTPPPPPEAGVGPGLIGIEEPFIVNRRRPMWQPTTKDEKMEPVFLDVDVDGIFKYEMTIPPNVKRASVDVRNLKNNPNFFAYPMHLQLFFHIVRVCASSILHINVSELIVNVIVNSRPNTRRVLLTSDSTPVNHLVKVTCKSL